MATEEQLLAGLKAADAAGNTADAQHFADQIKALRSGPSQQAGPQPTVMQTIAASPVGRGIHDTIIAPLEGVVNLLHPVDFSFAEKPYQNAIAAQQNRPGYGDALQQAQGIAAKRPTGLTDQMLAPFAPAMAGVAGLATGGLNGMNAAADVQAAGQKDYQQANPIKSTVAQITGGLLAMPAGGPAALPAATSGPGKVLEKLGGNPVLPNNAAAVQKMTIDQINAAKDAKYQIVDNSPMRVAAPEIQNLHADLQAKLARRGLNEDTMPELAPKLNAAMKSLKKAGTSDQTLQDLDIQRRIAGIAAGSIDKTERSAARIVQDGIDDLISNLKPNQLSGPVDQAAIDALPEARDLASRSFKAQQLQDIINKAGNNATGFSQSGYENALRNGFRKLLNNDRAIRRFNPDEVAAIKQVATGGNSISATNLLRQIGKLSPQGAIPLLAEGGAVLKYGPAALAAPAAGLAGRAGATALQKAAASRAVDLALSGAPSAAAPAALSAPAITSASRIPYGVAASLASILASQPAAAQSPDRQSLAAILSQQGNR